MHAALTDISDKQRHRGLVAAFLLACGFLLRFYFLQKHAFLAADSILYQDIALNWLHHHIYGLTEGVQIRATLIRLPGYPSILAALSWLFDRFLHATPGTLRSFLPLLWLQIAADLATCCIVAIMARKIGGTACGLAALALACLCPFTANYAVAPLTETFTLFFLALAFYLLQHWLDDRRTRWVVPLAFALSCSVLLRPDEGLLAVALLPVLLMGGRHKPLLQRLQPATLCVVLTALPFVPWTIRNYSTFHVFQPIAPKQAVDPGEPAPIHFERWFRTWGVDFTATQDAYWNYPEDLINTADLPDRAFDSPSQRQQTEKLLQQAGYEGKLNPQVEAGFETLARERVATHPLRYYLVLPLARLTNMLFHPRTEMLPVAERWWQFSKHPWQTIFALAYGALNLAYFFAAIAGLRSALKRERLLVLSMAGYIALRCLLLLTLDNPEQRYTLEFFPLLIVFAACLWMNPRQPPKGSSADGP
ncbi:glycosyltransferase family 39 protein [Terriglobus sp. TAA 43]|uniref:glycosyltransferase family 39 protein n=1 Tax=Terriglobus sp. TAA 43 TaxID=278961 RepID=UPI00068C12D5|nr:glycosyltransferase family 39 protein [Terriglobus sp. TAA 43]